MLLLTHQSQALYTNYLDVAVATLTGVSNELANIPEPTKEHKKQLAAVKKALKDLSKPSDSVAQDYNLFVLAVVHLGDLAEDPLFDQIGTNAFNTFIAEAAAEGGAIEARINALNEFVTVKKAASNQLAKAEATFETLSTETNKQRGLLLGRQLFTRLVAANKLAAKGEAHSGFAADSVLGGTLHHEEGDNSGDVAFTGATTGTQTETGGSPQDIGYDYDRTGLNTATLRIEEPSGTNTVKLTFTSTSTGKFTFKFVGNEGNDSGRGTFALTFGPL